MDQTIADAALSSDEDEQLPVDNLAVGYQLLADRPGDASPDSVAEPSVAEMHSGTSSSNASDCDEGTSSPFNGEAADFPALAARLLDTAGVIQVPAIRHMGGLAGDSPEGAGQCRRRERDSQTAGVAAVSKASGRSELGAPSRQAAAASNRRAIENIIGADHRTQLALEVAKGRSSPADVPAPQHPKSQSWRAEQSGIATSAADQAVAGGRAGGSGSLVDTKDSNDNSASDGTGNQRNKGSKPSALSEGQRVAVLQAMQTVQLDYRPAWADVVPEESWVQRLNELREALQGGV